MKKIVDITGMTKEEVKGLVKFEGYHPNSFYRIWKNKSMRLTIESK